jgi:hypothetical protein
MVIGMNWLFAALCAACMEGKITIMLVRVKECTAVKGETTHDNNRYLGSDLNKRAVIGIRWTCHFDRSIGNDFIHIHIGLGA